MKLSHTHHVTKTGQIKRNPRRKHGTIVSVYHGTTIKRAKQYRMYGTKDLYVTTSPFSAHHFANNQMHDDGSGPCLLKIEVPIDRIYWARWDELKIIENVTLFEYTHEDEARYERNGDEYLFIKGEIRPYQIRRLPTSEMNRLVAFEESLYKDDPRMSDDIFGPSPEERRERNGKSK